MLERGKSAVLIINDPAPDDMAPFLQVPIAAFSWILWMQDVNSDSTFIIRKMKKGRIVRFLVDFKNLVSVRVSNSTFRPIACPLIFHLFSA